MPIGIGEKSQGIQGAVTRRVVVPNAVTQLDNVLLAKKSVIVMNDSPVNSDIWIALVQADVVWGGANMFVLQPPSVPGTTHDGGVFEIELDNPNTHIFAISGVANAAAIVIESW